MTKPTVHDVHATIIAAARCQLTTSLDARAIVDAGFGDQLANLIHSISGNACNPIVARFEDFYEQRG
jgi:hypothetical protein